jgi:hypothetical protein
MREIYPNALERYFTSTQISYVEQCFVESTGSTGLTILGFYYCSLRREDGMIEGCLHSVQVNSIRTILGSFQCPISKAIFEAGLFKALSSSWTVFPNLFFSMRLVVRWVRSTMGININTKYSIVWLYKLNIVGMQVHWKESIQ